MLVVFPDEAPAVRIAPGENGLLSNSTPAGDGDSIPAGVARYALFMLTVAYALNFIDRQILVILQEPIKVDMGLSDAQLGLLSAAS